MKINKMPTTILLLGFSWLVVILGFFAGGYLIFARPKELNSLISGLSILLVTLFLASIIRMLGNAGQILFDLLRETSGLTQGLKSLQQGLTSQLQEQIIAIRNDLQALSNTIKQMGCHSKDINQNISQITTFFEQIERHLDLKK